jgi:aldose sugar dehydrogenase
MQTRRRRVLSRLAITSAALAGSMIATGLAQPDRSETPRASGWRSTVQAKGIAHPWGITWLSDGRALITSKRGTLHMFSDGRLERVKMDGLPQLLVQGQGGLLDIAVHPDTSAGTRLYLTMSSGTQRENRTTLARGRLDGTSVSNIEVLFQVEPAKSGAQHFGSRLLWLPDGTLLMSIGDGGNPPTRIGAMLAREQAQNRESHLGSILRLTEDGKPAADNPFAGQAGARPEIWSFGHRNVQGLALDRESGRVWATEHGPFGGDELNLIERGANYGWPLTSRGRDYRTRQPIGNPTVEGTVDPKVVWTPAHAPSGLAFYTGDRFPDWRGSLFSGGLVTEDVRRISLDGSGTVTGQERLPIGARVRDVRQGPDGFLYVLTDEENGRLLRIEPEQSR